MQHWILRKNLLECVEGDAHIAPPVDFFSILPPLKGEGDQRSWWRGSAEIFYFCFRFHRRNPSVKPAACQLSTRHALRVPFQGSLLRKLFVCSSAAMSKPSGGIRSLPSLSAWGLPTPVVAFACIGNVDIQEFSCVGGRLYFIRRLQAGGGAL